MTITSIVLSLPYNSVVTLSDPLLIGSSVLRVCREGTGYLDSNGAAPGNRKFKHNSGAGNIEFLNPGSAGNPTTDLSPEKVYVRLKYY